MALFLSLPIQLRIVLAGVLGLGLAPIVNWAIYQLAFFPRPIGPWSILSQGIGRRSWADCIPVYGWWRMRRESEFHIRNCIERLGLETRFDGRWFWIRPMLIELLFPIITGSLYFFEINGGLMPRNSALWMGLTTEMHVQYLGHVLLMCLMTTAAFIDFDERCIPDTITTPGTLFALTLATLLPGWHLYYFVTGMRLEFEPLHPMAPQEWPVAWNGLTGLCIGLACFTLWCFALADRRIILRRGIVKAVQFFLAGMFRHRSWRRTWRWLFAIWIIGSGLIYVAYLCVSPLSWQALLSSLLGMVLGGAIVWSVRIVAGIAMGVEALGFGDVTLMAMIGAFLGWQPVALAFGLAPMVAILFVLVKWIVTGDKATPYGPYLCAATAFVLVTWDRLFNGWAVELFQMAGILFWVMVGCLLLMGSMLWIWRLIKQIIFR